jgi:hypothetical protein
MCCSVPAWLLLLLLPVYPVREQSSPDRHFVDRSNATDLSKQTFYQILEATWLVQVTMRFMGTWVSLKFDFFDFGLTFVSAHDLLLRALERQARQCNRQRQQAASHARLRQATCCAA